MPATALHAHRFLGFGPGPRLLFLGAVHGNETCGTRALERLVAELAQGTLRIARGALTVVPVTNPLAFASPLPDHDAPLVIDLALSVAARGKIVAAQKAGKSIPEGWAVDAEGQPTTDPNAALAGTLSPIGGAKGGALALMVEILGAALTAGAFGWEASSFFDAEGSPPDMGHLFIAIDPGPTSGQSFGERMRVLLSSMAAEPDVRLPGTRRLAARAKAQQEGIQISIALHKEINALFNQSRSA